MTPEHAALVARLERTDCHHCKDAAAAIRALSAGRDDLAARIDHCSEGSVLCWEYERTQLRDALAKAKETIHAWHGDVAWEIYDRASPEMKIINAALKP